MNISKPPLRACSSDEDVDFLAVPEQWMDANCIHRWCDLHPITCTRDAYWRWKQPAGGKINCITSLLMTRNGNFAMHQCISDSLYYKFSNDAKWNGPKIQDKYNIIWKTKLSLYSRKHNWLLPGCSDHGWFHIVNKKRSGAILQKLDILWTFKSCSQNRLDILWL